jgi:hypothetical protein
MADTVAALAISGNGHSGNFGLAILVAVLAISSAMKLGPYLEAKGLRPAQFARHPDMQVSTSTVTRLLNGKRGASRKLMAKIQRATGGDVTPNDWVDAA